MIGLYASSLRLLQTPLAFCKEIKTLDKNSQDHLYFSDFYFDSDKFYSGRKFSYQELKKKIQRQLCNFQSWQALIKYGTVAIEKGDKKDLKTYI